MSNIGKHLVEVTNYGSAWYRGTIQSETDKSYLVMMPGPDRLGRRVYKSAGDVILPDDADIDRALRWFRERWNEFDGPVSGAEAALTEAKRQRAEAALEALKAGA